MGVLLLYMDKAVVAVSDVLQNLILQAVLRCLINILWIGVILKTHPFQNKLMNFVNLIKYITVGGLVLMKVAFLSRSITPLAVVVLDVKPLF